MSRKTRHPYHLVEESPWPLLASLAGGLIVWGGILALHYKERRIFLIARLALGLVCFQWWRDVVYEATFEGLHSYSVELGVRWGVGLFIISEVCFFASFFWAFFHIRLRPRMEIGCSWPPLGVVTVEPFGVPLLNTFILLLSGATVTLSHHRLLNRNVQISYRWLGYTILLGVYFTLLQGMEYYETFFTIQDGVFGSTFFIATGFHGLHVLVGTSFLLVCYGRLGRGHFCKNHHIGYEAAIWYWHFVDVVWLFLYIFIYFWSRI